MGPIDIGLGGRVDLCGQAGYAGVGGIASVLELAAVAVKFPSSRLGE